MRRQVESWQQTQITDEQAKLIFSRPLSKENSMPRRDFYLMSTGCTLSRNIRNLRPGRCGACLNAFTSAFKELDPIPQYKATAKLAGFLQSVARS